MSNSVSSVNHTELQQIYLAIRCFRQKTERSSRLHDIEAADQNFDLHFCLVMRQHLAWIRADRRKHGAD